MQKIMILGAGVFAQEIADVISEIPGHETLGFVEGIDRRRCAEPILGLPVHWVDEIGGYKDICRAVCAVGSPQRDAFISQAYAQGLRFTSVVHPMARVSTTSVLGEGTIVGPGALIGAHTEIGRHAIVNRGSLIGHHCAIGDYVTIGPGANIAGKTRIGAFSLIAMGAIVIDGLSIGARCIIAAGAVVTRDVPDGVRVGGVPARAF